MKAKHTKGLWNIKQWEYISPPRKELVLENGEYRLATIAADFSGNNPYTIPLEEAEANARLIAAAPELLEACKSALWAATSPVNLDNYDESEAALKKVIAQLKTAIAKATGKD